MTIRAGDQPLAPAVIAFVQRALDRWRGGAAVALFVGGLLAMRFTFFQRATYESQATLALSDRAEEIPRPEGLRGALERALPDLARERARGDAASLFAVVGGSRVLFACRAGQAQVAHQRCTELAARALRRLRALRIEQPASLPADPLPLSRANRLIALGASIFLGLFSGVLWMVALAGLVRTRGALRPAAQHRTAQREAATPRASAARPLEVNTVSALAPSSKQREGAELSSVQAPSAWALPAALAIDHEDLAPLCSPLLLAAAERSVVVGVAGDEALRDEKPGVAARLALSLSERARVLLVELDFDAPNLARALALDVPPRLGFSQQLQAHVRDGASGASSPWTVVRCTPQLSVLAEGSVRTPGMLQTHVLTSALSALRGHFDLVVLNGPRSEVDSERRAFSELADAIVYLTAEQGERGQARAAQWFSPPQLFAVVATG